MLIVEKKKNLDRFDHCPPGDRDPAVQLEIPASCRGRRIIRILFLKLAKIDVIQHPSQKEEEKKYAEADNGRNLQI